MYVIVSARWLGCPAIKIESQWLLEDSINEHVND
jgi:hypothetical protein